MMDFPIYPKNMTREERVNFLQHHLDVAVNHIRNLEGDLGTAREALRQAATIEVNSGEENARLITLVAQLKARVGELGAENDRLQRSEYTDGRQAYTDGYAVGHRDGYGDAVEEFTGVE